MDEIDAAQPITQALVDDGIATCRRAAAQPLPTSEYCLWCFTATNGPRWCCAEHRDEYLAGIR